MSTTDAQPFSLRAWLKNAPWLVIAIAIHAVVLAGMYIWHIGQEKKEEEISTFQAKVSERPVENQLAPPPPEIIQRNEVPENIEAEIVEHERDIYIPTDQVVEPDYTQEVGDPFATDDMESARSSTSIGVGKNGQRGSGHTGFFKSRGAGTGSTGPKGRVSSATQGTEKAVVEGMRWLLRHQNEDGSWSAANWAHNCSSSKPCRQSEIQASQVHDIGLTGLALLAFLGAGYSHESKQILADVIENKAYKVGERIKAGLMWLKDQQEKDGSFCPDATVMYNEALATMALVENYGLTGSKYWRESAQNGVNFLCRAQRVNPDLGGGLWGWRYAAREEVEAKYAGTGGAGNEELFDSDTSVTAWCVMALKSAQICGFDVPEANMQGALDFVEYCTDKSGSGLVGYLKPEGAGRPVTGGHRYDDFTYHVGTMSALGMLVRTFVTHDASDPILDLSAKVLLKDLPDGDVPAQGQSPIDYYYWYYGSLALNQVDGPDSPRRTGKYWEPWEAAMSTVLLDLQSKEERSCERGGWMEPDRWSYHNSGPVYSTAINVLTLEVYYRFENAFGARAKDTGKAAVQAKDSGGSEPPK